MIRWRKASRSAQDTACIELAHTGTAVRDSKNPNGPTLTVATHTLLTAVKTGRLDRP
ncbi:DUF397 domain-containing protein [Actinophytocola sp.]|uniref:DUF397 domain-containing protein n=1 Tax=Actinophytocola sp. TaxID=1872138 RepID=UPI002ED198C2